MMKTIQMTINDSLLAQLDFAAEELATTRSAFIREAVQKALRQHRIRQLEQQHAAGYARHPVEPGEFDVWDTELTWGES